MPEGEEKKEEVTSKVYEKWKKKIVYIRNATPEITDTRTGIQRRD